MTKLPIIINCIYKIAHIYFQTLASFSSNSNPSLLSFQNPSLLSLSPNLKTPAPMTDTTVSTISSALLYQRLFLLSHGIHHHSLCCPWFQIRFRWANFNFDFWLLVLSPRVSISYPPSTFHDWRIFLNFGLLFVCLVGEKVKKMTKFCLVGEKVSEKETKLFYFLWIWVVWLVRKCNKNVSRYFLMFN